MPKLALASIDVPEAATSAMTNSFTIQGENKTLSTAATAAGTGVFANEIATKLNAANHTINGKPVKATNQGNRLYIMAVLNDGVSLSTAFTTNFFAAGTASANWTVTSVEDPYVDPTAGMELSSGVTAKVLGAAAATAALSRLIK